MLELVRDDWTLLRDLYRNDRTSLTGYDLINNYIYWPDQAENVKIYTTNENWLKHGSFVLIVSSFQFTCALCLLIINSITAQFQ